MHNTELGKPSVEVGDHCVGVESTMSPESSRSEMEMIMRYLENKFEQMNNDSKQMNLEFNKKFDNIDKKFKQLCSERKHMVAQFREVRIKKFDQSNSNHTELNNKIDQTGEKLNNKIKKVKKTVNNNHVDVKAEGLNKQMNSMVVKTKRNSDKI